MRNRNKLIKNLTAENINVILNDLDGHCIGLNYDLDKTIQVKKIVSNMGYIIINKHEYFYTYKKQPPVDLIIF